jgi:DNA-binding transcriptional regulator YdaS (Cro superfamily)
MRKICPADALARAVKILGGQRATALAIGVTQPAISQALMRGRIAAELVSPLVIACRRVPREKGDPRPPTRYELRPDIYGVLPRYTGARPLKAAKRARPAGSTGAPAR